MTIGKYDAGSIEVLKGLDGVRLRPSMYVGDVGTDGFHHLLWEILDNSLDEAIAGHCDKITVTLHKDGSASIEDNGRGIPVEKHPTEKISTLDVVFCILHAGGKFGHKNYSVSGGLHGVGASVVNALSEWIDVCVKRDGHEWHRRYNRGVASDKMVTKGKKISSKNTGTFVHFLPDKKYFKGCEFNKSIVSRRLRELSYLSAGLEIEFVCESDNIREKFKHDGGLSEYVTYLINGKKMLHKPFHIKSRDVAGCSVDMSFGYDDQYDETIKTFANNIPTIEGGVHQNAALDSLCKVITQLAQSSGLLKGLEGIDVNKSDVTEGLTLVLNVLVPDPQFGGQTKTKLSNADLRDPFGEWMQVQIEKALKSDKGVASTICQKIVDAIKARDAARKAKNLSRKKSTLESLTLPGKLADCTSKDPELCECFLCEGDCFAPDTLIHTKDGLVRLDEIKNGDLIYTHMHRYRPAILRKPKVKKRKCRIVIQGREFVCSEDHLFLVLRVDGDKNWAEWCPAKELKTTDLIVKTALVSDSVFDSEEIIRQIK